MSRVLRGRESPWVLDQFATKEMQGSVRVSQTVGADRASLLQTIEPHSLEVK
jgi:hypothetical protein